MSDMLVIGSLESKQRYTKIMDSKQAAGLKKLFKVFIVFTRTQNIHGEGGMKIPCILFKIL